MPSQKKNPDSYARKRDRQTSRKCCPIGVKTGQKYPKIPKTVDILGSGGAHGVARPCAHVARSCAGPTPGENSVPRTFPNRSAQDARDAPLYLWSPKGSCLPFGAELPKHMFSSSRGYPENPESRFGTRRIRVQGGKNSRSSVSPKPR